MFASVPELIGIEKKWIMGQPDEDHVSTSYAERQHLTMRLNIRRLTGLTNGFSKKVGAIHTKPAMAAGARITSGRSRKSSSLFKADKRRVCPASPKLYQYPHPSSLTLIASVSYVIRDSVNEDMMRGYHSCGMVLVFLLTAACQEPLRPGPLAIESDVKLPEARNAVVVMTRNVYVGADLSRIAGPPTAVPLQVAQTFRIVQQSNFEERAKSLAMEVERSQPHLIGLQEVSLIRIQTPSDAVYGGTTLATEVYADYLQILLAALAARGLSYTPVAITQDFDIEAPMVTSAAPTFSDLRLTDREVILARSDVAVSNVQQHNYLAYTRLFGFIPTLRGWAAVDATIGGKTFRFVTTHLEPDSQDPAVNAIQVAQANELLAAQSGATIPVIILGDFNSAADGSTTATYGNVLAAGYRDAWGETRPGARGYTCCQSEDLRNRVSQFHARIDLIFFRGELSALAAAEVAIVPADKTPSGLWPSDHAGVYAGLRVH